MPGSIYDRNLRLARAYSEGFEVEPEGVNPHDPDVDPDAYAAWEAGYLQSCDPDSYRGNALNTANYWCAEGGPGGN